ncbi:Pumilio-like protein [Thalictrum thalictroides]|uniref:Pumilio-like protein n=1 Tax=Thalictrum thalictroides TaxID=46969 RepID=A0A7J6VBG8_THATH|nr:Pumilio-like protein [Thalictrum thalictroides]
MSESSDKNVEGDSEANLPEDNNISAKGVGKKDPSTRRFELVNSGLAEVATGGAGSILVTPLADKLNVLHRAIASLAALSKTEESDKEHVLENFHSSRAIRKLVLDCPTFATTLWKVALEGKGQIWAQGHSCKVVTAFLESSDPSVRDMAIAELQPLIDGGILKVPDSKISAKEG